MTTEVQYTCSVVRDTVILCKLEHEVEEDTTFSYTEHNLPMHEFCNVCHDGKDPSLYDNWDTGTVQNGNVTHVPEDQAFSWAVISIKEWVMYDKDNVYDQEGFF